MRHGGIPVDGLFLWHAKDPRGPRGPEVSGREVWLRGTYEGDQARVAYSLDGRTYTDAPVALPPLKFGHWKGARVALFNHGAPPALWT